MIVTVTLNATVDRTLGVERLARSGVLRARLVRLVPSGKGVNVSAALAALGLRSVAVGFVGRNELDLYRRALHALGVRPRLIPLPVRTRMNTTLLWSKPRPGELHLREAGDPVGAPAFARLGKCLKQLSGPRATFVFSGSAPPDASTGILKRLLALARSGGASVCVDTSGSGLRAAVDSRVDLIKPNEDELAELTGMPVATLADVLATARTLLDRVETVLVSRGARGAVLVRRDGAWSASVRVPVGYAINSVGAGDAFMAGWLFARSRRRTPADCLASAVAAGAANALEPSAGVVRPGKYRALLRDVVLKRH